MPVQRGEGDLVEVDDADVRDTGACESCCAVRADAAEANDYDKGGAEACQAWWSKE